MRKNVLDAVGMSFALRLINMAMGILIIPVLFRMMGKEELAGWFLIINNIPFLGLLDFGLTPTLWRRVALLYGKLTTAKSERRQSNLDKRMRQMFATGKTLFETRSLVALVISLVAGLGYLMTLKLSPGTRSEIMIGWAIVAVSQAIQIRGSIWSVFLLTTGNAALDVALTIVTSTLDLLFRFVVVLLGGGIIALASVTAVFVIARRMLSAHFARKRLTRWVSGGEKFSRTIVGSLIRPMASAWMIGLGSYLLLRTDQYFISSMLGPTELPAYQGMAQVISSLSQVALLTGGAVSVFMSHSWAAGKVDVFRSMVGLSLKIALAILWFGSATLMAIGASFYGLWLHGNFVGYTLLSVFVVTTILNAQTSMLMDADRSTEHEVYGRVVIICGLLNVVITYVLARWLGLVGIAASTAIATLLTTAWVAARNAQRRLGIGFFSMVVPIQLRSALLAACVYGLIKLIQMLAGPARMTARLDVMLGLAIGPPALAAWIWFGVFSGPQRTTLLRHMRDTIGRLGVAR